MQRAVREGQGQGEKLCPVKTKLLDFDVRALVPRDGRNGARARELSDIRVYVCVYTRTRERQRGKSGPR